MRSSLTMKSSPFLTFLLSSPSSSPPPSVSFLPFPFIRISLSLLSPFFPATLPLSHTLSSPRPSRRSRKRKGTLPRELESLIVNFNDVTTEDPDVPSFPLFLPLSLSHLSRSMLMITVGTGSNRLDLHARSVRHEDGGRCVLVLPRSRSVGHAARYLCPLSFLLPSFSFLFLRHVTYVCGLFCISSSHQYQRVWMRRRLDFTPRRSVRLSFVYRSIRRDLIFGR